MLRTPSSCATVKLSAGVRLRAVIRDHRPTPVVGTINAYTAIMAEKVGHKLLYLSGSGVAAASYGLPDLGITTLNDVVEDAKRITRVTDVPLLVDIDTGFGSSAFNIGRTIQEMEKAGVGGVHIEDQVAAKRCGHRPGKQIVSKEEMVERIKSAIAARSDPSFLIMARTDALANEGLEKAIERSKAYIEAGADALFPEALTKLEEYAAFHKHFPNIPILANITEFGKTPLFTVSELGSVGVSLVLYPLTAFRAMNAAALNVYETILKEGSQKSCVDKMQTRDELYNFLEYHKYEQELDKLFGKDKP